MYAFLYIGIISGDNLSSNALAGFRQCSNLSRICRMYMVSHAELAEIMSEDTVTMRHSVTHSYHVDAVSQHLTNAAIYGVNGPSVFSTL